MTSLLHQLHVWQRREWLYRAAWGFARWAVLVVVVLTAACLTDWIVDRYIETPIWLRAVMTIGQAVAYGLAAYWLIFRLRVPTLDSLAARAEAAFPELGHRIVTAVQLNRPTARTAGMSRSLIAAVTAEAERMSGEKNFPALADRTRVGWGVALLVPVVVAAAGFAAFRPELVTALLSRQFLINVPIPRSVTVTHDSRQIWPSGEEVELRFLAAGPVDESTSGTASVYPDGQPSERFLLTFAGRAADGRAVFTATLPPSATPFEVVGRVGDGRTFEHLRVEFAPRPVIDEVAAWVLLPKYVDPDGQRRYERFQPEGEVFAVRDSDIRVEAKISKAVEKAELVLLARNPDGTEDESGRLPMVIGPDGSTVSATFGLPDRSASYRIEAVDEHGFAVLNPPHRGITLAPDEPPRVELLQEVLKGTSDGGPLDDYEVNGMPLLMGGQVQVGYRARSPLGLDRAFIVYRVNEGPWTPLPLAPTVANEAEIGAFLPRLGVFEKSGVYGEVEFYRLPAADPDREPPGTEAGGRYNFQTAALRKTTDDGKTAELEVGDRVEFLVAVYDRNPAPAEPPGPPEIVYPTEASADPAAPPGKRPPGRSESRIKTVVTATQLNDWLEQRDRSRDRLRQIEQRQQGVFGQTSR